MQIWLIVLRWFCVFWYWCCSAKNYPFLCSSQTFLTTFNQLVILAMLLSTVTLTIMALLMNSGRGRRCWNMSSSPFTPLTLIVTFTVAIDNSSHGSHWWWWWSVVVVVGIKEFFKETQAREKQFPSDAPTWKYATLIFSKSKSISLKTTAA